MKKQSWLTGLALLLVFALSACSGANESSGPASGKEKTDMRTYHSSKGDVKIPAHPKRIVTDFYAGELFTVDANVVGAGSWSFKNPFIKTQLKNVTDVGDSVNVEKVMQLKPDVIVLMKDDQYDKLSKIAPTIVIPFNTAKNVKDTVSLFGDIAGAKDKAKSFMADFNKKAETDKKKLEGVISKDATFGLYESTDKGELWVFNDHSGRGGQAVYNALGLKAPPKVEKDIMKTGEMKQISQEVVPEYAADYMFITDYNPNGESKTLQRLKESPIWKNLDAVKKNRVFINDFNTFYPYDPISVSKQMDLITDMLIKRAEENKK
ncbi:iron-hydroxamate ABC transporter substrate-binding protein [Bacillus nakamurai]|uniref:iron-hydroxamate ABC transporter substrate-binding protein n=1 Tax=Bacillus nakamurai TaxID=1793963 RepID=UPI0020C49BB5|nr:iron-hydroxamate ABC transporter substrate-binding protein [Bacillus nakamurai]MCP6680703.1 iron-hydroxamate ABC transporter substrate-binding protein [Bacillus nakamurai]